MVKNDRRILHMVQRIHCKQEYRMQRVRKLLRVQTLRQGLLHERNRRVRIQKRVE